MTPVEFIRDGPKTSEDLIGKAKRISKLYCSKIESGDENPIRLLFYGDPGIGKSTVCKIIASKLVSNMNMVRHVSAAQVTAEMIREWMNDLAYIRQEWSVYWIEEVDAVNPVVEVLMLQFLDQLPKKTAVLLTSNAKMSGITTRFSSRTQAIKFDKPNIKEVSAFLIKHWKQLGAEAEKIAESNNGDVRSSLNDAQLSLDIVCYGKDVG